MWMLRRFTCVQIFLKLGTGPMAVGGMKKYMGATAESGKNLVSKHQPIRFSRVRTNQSDSAEYGK